jgi:hypothetical protein
LSSQDISSPEGPSNYHTKKSPGASLSSPACHLDKLKLEAGGGGGLTPGHHPHHPLLYGGDPYSGKLTGATDMYGMAPDYSRLMAAAGGANSSPAGDYGKLLNGGGGGGGGGSHSDYSKLLVGSGAMGGDYTKLLGGGYHPFMQNTYMASQLNMGQGQIPGIVPTTY